jgi:ATP-dependent DNA ligase
MKPLLAHKYEAHRVPFGTPLFVQPKLNGVRALAGTDNQGRWRFQSRDELPWDYEILEHLSTELASLGVPKDYVLDGELYVHGWSLQKINGAITPVRKELRDDTHLVEYHIFDRVDFQLPFSDRYDLIHRWIFRGGERVHMVPTLRIRDIGPSIESHYSRFVSAGYEGMMYRIGDCPYTRPKQERVYTSHNEQTYPYLRTQSKFLSDKDNRVWHMLKRKDWQDGEFKCIGVIEGEGKRAGMVGSFLCETPPFTIVPFSVGVFMGFTDSDLTYYFQNPPIGRKLKIKYLTLSDEGKPLNATVLAVL